MNVLVTGGCGFIGSSLVRLILRERPQWRVVTLDRLGYAGNLENLADVLEHPNHRFVRGDITDVACVEGCFDTHAIDAVMHLAAESHVDRAIDNAAAFVTTNVLGTQVLLDAARKRKSRRFLLASTDEVYGSADDGQSFAEDAPLAPSNPYSATKAAAELLACGHAQTYGLDVCISRATNTFGPRQFPEKLLPLMLLQAQDDSPLPIYGDGQQRRDWLAVEDHALALLHILEHGQAGETYNVAGRHELANLELVKALLARLGKPESLLRFVEDRPGHDRRYAIDDDKLRSQLGWKPTRSFDAALEETVRWYLDNPAWCEHVRSGEYRAFFERQYASRLEPKR